METTKQEQWSRIIKRQRIRWLGHVLRLPSDTPCRQAMDESMRAVRRPQGHPISTWIQEVKKDLKEKDVKFENIEELAADRTVWRGIVSKFYLLQC